MKLKKFAIKQEVLDSLDAKKVLIEQMFTVLSNINWEHQPIEMRRMYNKVHADYKKFLESA